MKSCFYFLFTLVAAGVFATPIEQSSQAGPADKTVEISGLSREKQGHIIVPNGIAPEVQELKPLHPDYVPGVKRRKIRYGKWSLPSVSSWTAMSLLTGEAGTMQSIQVNMKKPCESCGLLYMQAGLEYADGTVANTDTGAWLHHIVLILNGPGRSDVMCRTVPGQRFFSSGNERMLITYTDFDKKQVKSVYPVKTSDTFSMQLELMNLKEQPKEVYITLDYEFIDSVPAGFKETKAVWLDITGCGISSMNPPRGKMAFTLPSTKWTSPYDGQLLSTGGHLHDGGVNVKTYQKGNPICDARATYSKPANMKMGSSKTTRDVAHGNEDMPHIENMSTCEMMGTFSKGDQFWIDASYDFNQHPGMKANSGSYAEIMGIAILYIAV